MSFQTFSTDAPDLRTSTLGFPSDHVEAKVVDPQGRVVPVGAPGELCTRGYSTMMGYWDDEEKTKEVVDRAGWYHSG